MLLARSVGAALLGALSLTHLNASAVVDEFKGPIRGDAQKTPVSPEREAALRKRYPIATDSVESSETPRDSQEIFRMQLTDLQRCVKYEAPFTVRQGPQIAIVKLHHNQVQENVRKAIGNCGRAAVAGGVGALIATKGDAKAAVDTFFVVYKACMSALSFNDLFNEVVEGYTDCDYQ